MAASTLRWDELTSPAHAAMLEWYRDLIALRRAEPDLSDPRLDRVAVDYDATAGWVVVTRGDLRVVCNLAAEPLDVPLRASVDELLLSSAGPVADTGSGSLGMPAESVVIVRVAGS
jgi:maltooligosyltrehalose trehalohydrolase